MSANRFPTTHQVLLHVMVPMAIRQEVQGLPVMPTKKDEKKLQAHDSKQYFQPKNEKHHHQKPNHPVHQPGAGMGKGR